MISVESASHGKKSGLTRAVAGGVTLAAEYLVLAVLFDGTPLASGQDWWSAFGQVGALVSISVAVFTAGLLIRGGELIARLREATLLLPPLEPRWGFAHLLAFAGFAAATAAVFGSAGAPSLGMGASIALFITLGALSLLTLFRFTFGLAWRAVARALSGVFVAGFAFGLVAWIAGTQSVPLWPWLAGATLRASSWLLIPFADTVRVVPEELLLGIGDFDVTVGAPCSGMETLGAVSVFVLGYFYAFREQLRFPQSLLLVPVALLTAWTFNAVRIAALVVVGAYFSPEVALGGFHSKAGWIVLCLVALGVVVATRNSERFARAAAADAFTDGPTAAYVMPLLTFVGSGLVTGLFATGIDWLYPLPVMAAGAVAWRYRKAYPTPTLSWWGVFVGAAAFVAWVVLANPHAPDAVAEHERSLATASPWLQAIWLGFRVLGAVVVVPVIEELAFRGFLQRRLLGADFASVPQGRFGWLSLAVSSLAFGVLHPSFFAGTLAGVAYSVATYRRGRLEDAVVAHAVTNALLVIAGLAFGYRDLWH